MSAENEDLIVKLAVGLPVTKDDIQGELREICERVHSGCDDSCPVYRLNDHEVPGPDSHYGCSCFKDGERMMTFIQEAIASRGAR